MKYEFTGETKAHYGATLKRIRAVKAFDAVAAGDIGGWIQDEKNLSQSGNAWVYGDALVFGNARVFDNAWVFGAARVSGYARVSGAARVFGNARVYGAARVFGNALVFSAARVSGNTDFLLVGPIGSRKAFLTVTADAKIGVRYTTGCFSGSRAQLQAAVKKTHKPSTPYYKQYMSALAMAKVCVKTRKATK